MRCKYQIVTYGINNTWCLFVFWFDCVFMRKSWVTFKWVRAHFSAKSVQSTLSVPTKIRWRYTVRPEWVEIKKTLTSRDKKKIYFVGLCMCLSLHVCIYVKEWHRWERKCVRVWAGALCNPAAALLTRRLAREMVRAVDSASCWHLSLSAVAFSNLAVSLARFSLRCCSDTNAQRDTEIIEKLALLIQSSH